MARTVSDAITDARRLLQDQRTPYRYPDVDLIEYLNQALAATYKLRPDLMLGSTWAPPALLAAPDELPASVDTWFFGPIVSFIVGMAEARDDQFGESSRSVFFLGRLRGALQGDGV